MSRTLVYILQTVLQIAQFCQKKSYRGKIQPIKNCSYHGYNKDTFTKGTTIWFLWENSEHANFCEKQKNHRIFVEKYNDNFADSNSVEYWKKNFAEIDRMENVWKKAESKLIIPIITSTL